MDTRLIVQLEIRLLDLQRHGNRLRNSTFLITLETIKISLLLSSREFRNLVFNPISMLKSPIYLLEAGWNMFEVWMI
jgi:hypothetical protein